MELIRLFLPVLFPSWRFFAEIGASPRVAFCGGDGVWRQATDRPEHVTFGQAIRRLVWNPDWNEILFLVSLAERYLTEPEPWLLRELAERIQRRQGLSEMPALRIYLVSEDGRDLVFEGREGAA